LSLSEYEQATAECLGNMGGLGEEGMRSRERVFTILVVEDHGVIALEFEDAIRRHGGLVLGPAVRVSDALALSK
jgi:hypothetical protein